MNLKIKKLHEKAVVPTRNDGDACFDFYATEEVIDVQSRTLTYKLGWAVEIPTGHVGLLFMRSSVCNKDITLANAVGVIDSGYRGELMAKFKSLIPMRAKKYDVGDKIVQFLILPIPEVKLEVTDKLSESKRNDGSFGSTGV